MAGPVPIQSGQVALGDILSVMSQAGGADASLMGTGASAVGLSRVPALSVGDAGPVVSFAVLLSGFRNSPGRRALTDA